MNFDVTAAYQGVTTPLQDILAQIERLGWELRGIDKGDRGFKATATNPHGETMERTGVTDAHAAGNVLLAILRRHQIRTAAQHYGGMWGASWVDKLQEVAEAYAKAPVYDPKAAGAWRELAQDSMHRMRVLEQQIKIEVVDDPEPYANAQEMANDIHQNRHFFVSRANCDHPVWSVDENVAFRVVHDVLGHAVSGGDFGWHGENLACAAHFPLLSPTAQKALFTECIAQTAYAIYYRGFGPQKVAFLDEHIEPVQQQENPAGHSGIHPSQIVAPTTMPAIEPQTPEKDVQMPRGFISPHKEELFNSMAPGGVLSSKISTTLRDPNHGWKSNLFAEPGSNAYMDMSLRHPETGDAIDPLDAHGVIENANLIDRQWWTWKKEDGSPDHDRMRQAIVNAFRVVLLSPRKDLRWNAIHYQDISHVPWNETDPARYWDALEKARQEHNSHHFGEGARYEHLKFKKLLPEFKAVLFTHYPHMSMAEVDEHMNNLIYEWRVEEEHKVLQEDEHKASHKQRRANDVENKVNAGIEKRIKHFIADSVPELDFDDTGSQRLSFTAQDNTLFEMEPEPVDLPVREQRYGAFMGTHLQSIAQISEHADAILQAALEDLHEHDGTGHHFRATTLNLQVPGVGPKVCSFAWLLLCPRTSELGTIDTHMMDVLGHDYEKEMNNRDYFKFERELAAGRDAAGYSHIPLGAFQWGMWDYKRTGPGTHQDHSAMAVIDPQPHHTVDWVGKAQNLKGDDWHRQAPWWWKQTEEARKRVAQEWDEQVGVAQNQIPWKVEASLRHQADEMRPKGKRPWVHMNGQTYTGQPGQTYAQVIREQVGRPAHSIWDSDHQVGRYDPDTQEGDPPPTIETTSAFVTVGQSLIKE
jgi:hypothetical protein